MSISKAKAQYSASLRQLEAISEEIHLRRKDKVSLLVGVFVQWMYPFSNISKLGLVKV